MRAITSTQVPREMSMLEAAKLYKAMGDEWRSDERSAEIIEKFVGSSRYPAHRLLPIFPHIPSTSHTHTLTKRYVDIFGRLPKQGSKYSSDTGGIHFYINNQTS